VACADYAREQLHFPGLRLLLRVDRQQRQGGVTVLHETRYFACSLDPGGVTAAGLLALVRGHWSVENSLHFVKDRWWDEDRHYLSRPGLAERFALLTNAALAVLRVTTAEGQPLRARADQLSRRVEEAIQLLTAEGSS
jgi:hypothetical protein